MSATFIERSEFNSLKTRIGEDIAIFGTTNDPPELQGLREQNELDRELGTYRSREKDS